jgi:3-hydroxyacyl-[acyl-carrier-protein] dehydratase
MIERIELPIQIMDIMKYMPHRYPFLLVDRVVDIDYEKSIKVLKNVTINEHFFAGHFPDYPVMPGVLIIEAMAQSAGILNVLSFGENKEGEICFFAAINNARFKRQVIPGDALIISVELINTKSGISKYTATATVEGAVAAIAEIIIAKKKTS